MAFDVEITIDENSLNYVNEKIHVNSNITYGPLLLSTLTSKGMTIVSAGGVTVDDIIPVYSDYSINSISKITWQTQDGYFYNGDGFEHIFRTSGEQQVTITVWSEEMLFEGIPFTFQYTTYKLVTLTSYFLKFMTTKLPMLSRNPNQEMVDLLTAGANFFDVMYNKVAGIYNLIDIEKVSPEYFEELSLTLGHIQQYSKKVGGDASTAEFDTYDIFDRIKNGVATDEEIRKFRYFLLYSTQLFKTGGTGDNVIKFLSFFAIDGYAVDLWTQYWGLKPIGLTKETFAGLVDFNHNKLGLAWNEIKVIGNENEDAHFVKGFNSFTIDNYHKSQKIEYDSDVVGNNSVTNWAQFLLLHNAPLFIEVRRENGDEIVSMEEVTEFFDIVENTDDDTNGEFPWLLEVDPAYLDFGDRISVVYEVSNENTVLDSMVSDVKTKIQNFDLSTKFRLKDIPSNYKETNFSLPEYQTFIAFRGNLNLSSTEADETTIYNNFNEYYRVVVDSRRASVTLCKVIQDPDTAKLITQQINLNPGSDEKIYDKGILDSNGKDFYSFKTGILYELKIQLSGSYVSAYVREVTDENTIQNKIDADEGEIEWGQDRKNWITLFEKINLDVPNSEILSTDVDGDEIPSYPYTALLNAGYYGIGCRNSILEISEVTLDNLDADNTYYSTNEKELSIKPKYLEWLNTNLIKYNSYSLGQENSFSETVASPFDSSVSKYALDPNVVNAFKALYFDNAQVKEEVASRYTVIFNSDWVENTFDSAEELMSKIIVPVGSQSSWFAVESRIYDRDFYTNYFSENTVNHNFGTIDDPDLKSAPGFFAYTLSTTLDSYKTEPLDEFSSLVRTDNRNENTDVLINSSFSVNKRIQQYKLSNNPITISGLFEEACPFSNIFSSEELCGNLDIGENAFKNKLFFPIVVNSLSNQRVIGVRFKNCSDINDIIKRITGSNDTPAEVQLYGSYILQLPIEAVKFRPDLTYALEILESDPTTVVVKMTVPLGILNSQIQNYSLSTEFMHQIENSGGTSIILDGVYILVPRDLLIIKDAENLITLTSINPYENDDTEQKCRYYLSAQLNLSTTLTDYENINSANQVPYKYLMNYDFRKLLSNIKSTGGEYEDDYLWWLPREIWRKRDFVVQSLDPSNDVATGLNYDKNKDITKKFYGNDFNPSDVNTHNSLRIKITDGDINPYTVYYAKVKFRISYNGYDESFLGNASPIDGTVKDSRPLTGLEAKDVIVVGGQSNKYPSTTIMAPIAKCLEFYIPIAWYPESDLPTDGNIQWGNYIKGAVGDDIAPTVSLTPYGLMTWLLAHATDANKNIQDINKITSGWTIQDWNQRFLSMVNIEFIAEKVPSENYKLYEEFGFVSKYASTSGTTVNVKYDAGEMPWVVEDTAILSPYGYSSYYFSIPIEVFRLVNWFEDVQSISVNNFIVNENLYSIVGNTLTLKPDNLFNTVGPESQLKTLLSFDLFNGYTKKETLIDNFNDKRELVWLNYEENTAPEIFELAVRNPSSTLFLTGEDPAFQTAVYQNRNVYKKVQGKSTNVFDPKTSGGSTTNTTVKKNDNGGYTKTISLIDNKTDVYEVATKVLFDPTLNSIKNYDGKKFELILKAETTFNGNENKFILSSYYFVGIKTYGFDIALGVARYNPTTGLMEKTFLAGFGDYNSRNILTNNWYSLKAKVDGDYMRISFNNEGEDDRVVINYNINTRNQNDPNRYLTGQFEELVYLVTGLTDLKITYPEHLQSITGKTFYDQNWNQNWAINFKPTGSFCGIQVYNDKTYISEVSLTGSIQDERTYTSTFDVVNLNNVIIEIEHTYRPAGVISKIGKTTNGNIVVQFGSDLFYKRANNLTRRYIRDVAQTFIVGDNVVVKFNSNNSLRLAIIDQDFSKIRPVYVKDNFINSDHIYKYMVYTNRDIDNVFANNDKLYITFLDSDLPFSATPFRITEDEIYRITEETEYRVIDA
jgi:hypothetical protein